MPESTPERRATWHSDDVAMRFLTAHGLMLDSTWCWFSHDDRRLTDDEADAVLYLIEEWDFGGYIHNRIAKPRPSK